MPLGIPCPQDEMPFVKLPVMLCAEREQVSRPVPPSTRKEPNMMYL
jgi:hypothetical protein